MLKCRHALFFFLYCSILQAGWNEDFDAQSIALRNEIPGLQNKEYVQQYQNFKKIRKTLLKDKSVLKQIKNTPAGQKARIAKKNLNIIIKKRRNNHIHELSTWELSYLTGTNEYVVPSFPVDIDGVRVIVQEIETFETGTMDGGGYGGNTLKKVTPETYWKAHLQAYVLGLADLTCANIGVNSQGIIRFFDTESSFSYYNVPFKTALSFSTGFICQSFDWTQYRKPLDAETAARLRDYVNSLSNLEENLKIYQKHRSISISSENLQHRLDKVRNFKIEEGVTFRDFFGFVFPQMSLGLDELNGVVGGILHRKVDHGCALFFMCRYIKNYDLPPQTKLTLQNWINTYIE